MTKVPFSNEERKAVWDFIKIYSNKAIPVKEIQGLCDTLNLTFHDGNEVRKFPGVNAKVYKERILLAKGITPGRRQREATGSSAKTPKITALSRLVMCAKDIRKKAEDFCAVVIEFETEFEQNRQLMQRLTKVRQAVEEYQIAK